MMMKMMKMKKAGEGILKELDSRTGQTATIGAERTGENDREKRTTASTKRVQTQKRMGQMKKVKKQKLMQTGRGKDLR